MDLDALRAALDGRSPTVLLTLGSGLGELAGAVADAAVIPFAEVGLPDTTVPGHLGRFLAGTLEGVEVLVQQGRVHLYEGVGVGAVVAAVRAAAALGIGTYVVTNAAGGLAPEHEPGDLMVLTDHLNLTGANPLTGLVPPVFTDLSAAYDPALRAALLHAAADLGAALHQGVYAGLPGPSYETPAEVAMLRTLGAQAVGMSTVNEVVAARAAGMRVLGCSLITNVHRPGGTPTDHAEVLAAGAESGPTLARLLRRLLAATLRGQ